MRLLEMSVSAGILILAILILRRAGRRLFPARFLYLMWFVVLARLLLPLELPVQLPSMGPEAAWADEGQMLFIQEPAPDAGAYGLSGTGTDALFGKIVFLVWLDVCLGLLLFFAWSYIRQARYLNESLPLPDRGYLGQWKEAHPRHRGVGFLVYDRITSPVTYGIWNPRIIFPKDMDLEDARSLDHILRHEYVHIRRHDNLWKMVALTAACIHWFNPLVWVMWHCFNRDMELACDQEAVLGMDRNGRLAYAMTLLRYSEKNHKVSLLYNGFGKSSVKERIMILMKNDKRTRIGMVCSILVFTMSMTVFASTGRTSAGEANTGSLGTEGKSPARILAGTPQFKEYEALGMSYSPELDRIFYDTWGVGYFLDDYGDGTNRMDDLAGSLCLEAVRDESGNLAGFRETGETDFLKQATDAERSMASLRGYIKEYGPYGMAYDTRTGYLSFHGKLVEAIRDTSGCGIYVNGAMTRMDDTIGLLVERDGNGAVVDMKEVPAQEMSGILSQQIGVYRAGDGWRGDGD